MIKAIIKIWGLVVVAHSQVVYATDIYRSELPDGSVRYASQALDASYKLHQAEESVIAVGTTSAPAAFVTPGTAPRALDTLINRLAQKHAVNAALVRAIIEIESNFNANARSSKGAVGVMQLMPSTAAQYGVRNLQDPAQNIEAGIKHLKYLLALHRGNTALALASYNAGQGTVTKYGHRIPPYAETMLYVPAVLAKLPITTSSVFHKGNKNNDNLVPAP